jgi:AcrR family transcriptional regulator
MTEQRRLTDQGQQRRQQLITAAGELFSSRGYGATRVSDICAQAGVAKGLFYWYFDTKESLFAELVRSMRQALRRAQAAAINPDHDPITQIRVGAEATVRYMAQHQAFFELLDHERSSAALTGVLQEGSEIYLLDTAKIIGEAQRLGQIPEDADRELLALGVLGAVSHASSFHRTGRIDRSVDELAVFVGQWVVRGLGYEKGSGGERSALASFRGASD